MRHLTHLGIVLILIATGSSGIKSQNLANRSLGNKQMIPAEIQTTTAVGQFRVVDTGQEKCYNNRNEISAPKLGEAFYGQDAQFSGHQPSYANNGDGTVTDKVTGLIWQKEFEVLTFDEAVEKLKTFKLGNRTDWRIPSIKEAYSLIQFSGVDVSSREMNSLPENAKPFIETSFFDFKYGANGDRVIDVQLLSSTVYQGTTMGGNATVFGVNLADGRIKGYPIEGREGAKKYTVRFVSGNPEYGKNNFQDNGNETISDLATGLMWARNDSKSGMNWEEALAWTVQKNKENYLGYNDWRLPDAKELQSIVDYSRSLQKTQSAAINPLFQITEIKDEEGKPNYPFYWTSTTHQGQQGADAAVYICFGEALGFMKSPGNGQSKLMDVHGAGAQRSDPKAGNAASFPKGRGPQGDVIRISNFVRLVRNSK
jgi:hypothetical protein